MRIKTTYDVIHTKRTVRWRDTSGKRRQMTKRFFQTESPFNRVGDRQKTRAEIYSEIRQEGDQWLQEMKRLAELGRLPGQGNENQPSD